MTCLLDFHGIKRKGIAVVDRVTMTASVAVTVF